MSLIHVTEAQVIKENMIRLAREHKRHCAGSDCGISLYWLLRLLQIAGIPLTQEERLEFS